MAVVLNYRGIAGYEVALSTRLQKSLKKQLKYLTENREELVLRYSQRISSEYDYLTQPTEDIYAGQKKRESEISSEPLDGFFREMGVYKMIEDSKPSLRNAYNKGYKKRYRTWRDYMVANGYTYDDTLATAYTEEFGALNLSNYRGSISKTTKLDVTSVLKEGIDKNLSVDEMATNIQNLSNKLFSKARAKMIATTEIGRAYEYGNYKPVKQLYDVGVNVTKKRQTVQDSRVRPAHLENEDEGWVDLEYEYPATGTKLPPAGVNCRCTTLYEVN